MDFKKRNQAIQALNFLNLNNNANKALTSPHIKKQALAKLGEKLKIDRLSNISDREVNEIFRLAYTEKNKHAIALLALTDHPLFSLICEITSHKNNKFSRKLLINSSIEALKEYSFYLERELPPKEWIAKDEKIKK